MKSLLLKVARLDKKIPDGVIERLSAYLTCLLEYQEEGREVISSDLIGRHVEVNPAQIRRDLSYFGTFGQKGLGYKVKDLIEKIQEILGSDHPHRIALVGAGNLGMAVASYEGLKRHGFYVAAIFDNDPYKVGRKIGNLTVKHVKELSRAIKKMRISVGVIAVPEASVQEVADTLVKAGVKVILNYAPRMIHVPPHIKVHETDPAKELLHTLYYMSIRARTLNKEQKARGLKPL